MTKPIENLIQEVEKLPTIAPLNNIIHSLNKIRNLKKNTIINNMEKINKILDILVYSYDAGSNYEVDEINRRFLLDFSGWLIEISNHKDVEKTHADSLRALATAFSSFP